MHSNMDNIDTMINGEAGEIIKEPLDSLKSRYRVKIV